MARDLQQETSTMTDGRTARRERGKLAVLEAILEHLAETGGKEEAAPDVVAERAGVSVASLFRYFGTLDGMRQAAAQHWLRKNAHLLTITNLGEGSLEERIENFLQSRLVAFQAGKAAGRLVRRLAQENAEAHERLLHNRAGRLEQISQHFQNEVSSLSPRQGEHLVSVVATLTSHEALVQLTEQDGMELSDVVAPLRDALTCLLRSATGDRSERGPLKS